MFAIKILSDTKVIGVAEPAQCRAALRIVLELLRAELGHDPDSRHMPDQHEELCVAEDHIKELIDLL